MHRHRVQVRAIELRRSLRCFATVNCLLLAIIVATWDTPYRLYWLAASYHLLFAAALLISVLMPDRHSAKLRLIAAGLLAIGGIGAMGIGSHYSFLTVPCAIYVSVLILGAIECWRHWGEMAWLVGAAVNLIVLLAASLRASSNAFYDAVGPRGFFSLLGGIVSFVFAALISAQKCGLLKKVWKKFVDQAAHPPPDIGPGLPPWQK